jgi:hypothetical protein
MLTNLRRRALHVMLVALLAVLHVNCSKKQTATAAVTNDAATANTSNPASSSTGASTTDLQNYTGRYNINSDEISWAEITVENNRLYGQSSGSPKAELIKQEGDTYKVQGVDATVTFTRNSQQQVTGLLIKSQGYELKGEKAK